MHKRAALVSVEHIKHSNEQSIFIIKKMKAEMDI